MAQPTPYTRQFNFTDFQAVDPDEPLPGNQVDAELNAVKTTLDGTLQNLAAIQRDDGQLANNSVHPETLSNSVLTLMGSFSFEGEWATATEYAVKDIVTESSDTYLCLVAHTSGTFATDLAAAKWMLLTESGLKADGSVTPTANLPMGGFKLTNLGNGSARTDSINLGQAQDMSIQWGAVSGTANAIVLTLTPPITSYVAGQTIKFKATATNTAATTINAGGGVVAVRYNNAALAGGEIVNGRTYEITHDGTTWQLSNYHEATIPIAAGGTGQITASAAFGALKQAATDSATGVVEKATSTETAQATADKYPDAALIAAAPYIGRRNELINGDFGVWQRNTTFSTPSSGVYTADRWAVEYDGTIGTFVVSRLDIGASINDIRALSGSAPTYSLRWQHTAAGSGQTLKKLRQRIEGLHRFSGTSVRLTFAARTLSGTADISISTEYNYGTGGAPSAAEAGPTSGPFSLMTTAQRFSATLSIGNFNGKTFGTDGPRTSFLELGFDFPLNATHDIVLFDVQLEFGQASTRYDRRTFAEELLDCQRYYWKSFAYATAPAQNAGTTSALVWRAIVAGATATSNPQNYRLPRTMRGSPTYTSYNPSAANAQVRNLTDGADCTVASISGDDQQFNVAYTGTAGTAVNEILAVHVTAEAEL